MKKALGFMFVISCGLMSMAQDGGLLFRVRLIDVAPNDDSSEILDTGTQVAVDSAAVPELDLTFMLNKSWGLEIIAATSPHDLSTVNGALGGADAGEVWVLPPTLTLQYHSGGESVDFYAGIGINYTLFYNYDISDDLLGLGVDDVDFDNSFGFAGNMGIDFKLKGNWVFNIDLKYIDMATDAEILLVGGGVLDTVDVDINPFVGGIGIGYRF